MAMQSIADVLSTPFRKKSEPEVKWEQNPEGRAQNPHGHCGRYTLPNFHEVIKYERLAHQLRELGDPNHDKPILDFRQDIAKSQALYLFSNDEMVKRASLIQISKLHKKAEEGVANFMSVLWRYHTFSTAHEQGYRNAPCIQAVLIVQASDSDTFRNLVMQSRSLGLSLVITFGVRKSLDDYEILKSYSHGELSIW